MLSDGVIDVRKSDRRWIIKNRGCLSKIDATFLEIRVSLFRIPDEGHSASVPAMAGVATEEAGRDVATFQMIRRLAVSCLGSVEIPLRAFCQCRVFGVSQFGESSQKTLRRSLLLRRADGGRVMALREVASARRATALNAG